MKTKPKILYVEDEQWLMGGVFDFLSTDFVVLPARNSDQALTILRSDNQIKLIILDLMLPPGNNLPGANRGKRTGIELARIIRSDLQLKTPIICYTVITDPSTYKELEEIGVQAIVSKRELPAELESVIRKLLER